MLFVSLKMLAAEDVARQHGVPIPRGRLTSPLPLWLRLDGTLPAKGTSYLGAGPRQRHWDRAKVTPSDRLWF